ncbi:MAG: DedA family protein [bacterium]|nr:DedA family protein [bacterium]
MDFLPNIIALLDSSKYFLLFIGSFLEGSVVMMGGGLLWRLGTVDFWPMYLAVIAGDMLSDLVWYCVGYFAARPFIVRWGYLVEATPEVLLKLERRFRHHQSLILLASKLTMGFGLMIATLITAGMVRMSVWRYALINIGAGFLWVYLLVIIGYYFGNVFSFIPPGLQMGFGVVVVIGAYFGIRQISRSLARSDW